MAAIITSVVKHSPADKAKIKAQDILLKVNGNEIHDVLDYMFYIAEYNVEIEYQRGDIIKKVDIKKNEYDDIGLEFSSFLMDNKMTCRNKCVFCFIDQMPPGMRETLYFKDDDARLSFLQGNYVTLTNLDDKDIDRIINMRLNINISVHTTNPELRCTMMKNRFAGEKLKYLKRIADAGLNMNCQIVLCPGLNDGKELERTIDDLAALGDAVTSVAVVPVGLSKFRDNLYPLVPFNEQTAGAALDIIESKQKMFLNKYNTRIVFASDEFYLKAKRPIPDNDFYEDYPQYENGVGLIRTLTDEFTEALSLKEKCAENIDISIVTGFAAFDCINSLVEMAKEKWHNINCNIYAVKNNFFGENITVTGLLTGKDIIEQLSDKHIGEYLLISSSMLKTGTEILLDDMTVSDIEKELDVKIKIVNNNGFELLDAIVE